MPRSFAHARKREAPSGEDPFVERTWRLLAWAQEKARALLVAGVALGLLVAAAFYYRSYQANVREQAAAELQTLAGTLLARDPAVAAERLRTYVARYGSAPAADEGRLILARVQLDLQQPDAALQTLAPVLERRPPGTPLGQAARLLTAGALETKGDLAAAVRTLEELGEGAELAFQRRAARAKAARLLADAGDLRGATAIYEQLLTAAAEADQPAEEATYRLRLGELRALAEARPAGPEPTDTTSAALPAAAPSSRPSAAAGAGPPRGSPPEPPDSSRLR
ncbi:MAG: tetratricopeptide repeat protein [Gemmatimonadota bacterium]